MHGTDLRDIGVRYYVYPAWDPPSPRKWNETLCCMFGTCFGNVILFCFGSGHHCNCLLAVKQLTIDKKLTIRSVGTHPSSRETSNYIYTVFQYA